jgi:uncharacterized protein YdaU (DUF1376 family)
MHYYKFNIGDYMSHTSHLSEMEDLAYRRMLDWIYLHESPLPSSADQIAKLIRMRTHSECIADVLEEFFTPTDYGYEQAAAMKQISAYKAKSEKAKQAAEVRWSAERKESDANALQIECEGNANHKTLNINHETIKQSNNTLASVDAPPKKQPKGSRLPTDWKLNQDYYEAAKAINPNLNDQQIKFISDTFKDYWIAQAGSKGVKADWLATWRNWVRRDNSTPPPTQAPAPRKLMPKPGDDR